MRLCVNAWTGARPRALSAMGAADCLRSNPPPQREGRANIARRRRIEEAVPARVIRGRRRKRGAAAGGRTPHDAMHRRGGIQASWTRVRRTPIVRVTGRSGPVTENEPGHVGEDATPGAGWRQALRKRVTDMNARVSGELREYHAWLDGVEPAWTVLEPARWEALMREPSAENGALRLADDLTDTELDHSAIVRNALVLLRAAANGAGLELTARGYLTRANVAALRETMDWPGCAFEESRRAGKRSSEAQVGELRLVRALLEEAGCVEITRGGRLRASRRGQALLAGAKSALFAELFRIAFWRLSLNLFGTAECGSWPQQQVGMALWALSTTGHRFQGTRALMVVSVLPDEAVSRRPEWVATTLFSWRVLRPLWWFGLVECREQGEDLDAARWRKSVLFDRFLNFATDLARNFGAPH